MTSDAYIWKDDFTDEKLWDIAKIVKSMKWLAIGRRLQLNVKTLDEIKERCQHESWDERMFQMLNCWRERYPGNCTPDYLRDALRKESLNTEADEVWRFFTGPVQVGEISIVRKPCIAEGRFATIYRGTFQERSVAVKKFHGTYREISDKENNLLLQLTHHPNVVSYYHMVKNEGGFYIAMTLCECNLTEYIKHKDLATFSLVTILQDITNGLNFLHNLNIFHQNLKPSNILISSHNDLSKTTALITDFGVKKMVNSTGKDVSFEQDSRGWCSPETIQNEELTTATDVFSLGCIYFFVISNGDQLFTCDKDVLDKERYNGCVAVLCESAHGDYSSLIHNMIARDPKMRPNCDTVLQHNIFWENYQKIKFVQAVSDFIAVNDDAREELDSNSSEIIGHDWISKLPDALLSDITFGKWRKDKEDKKGKTLITKQYTGKTLSSMLRTITNIYIHYNDMINLAINEIPSAEECLPYFLDIFPRILSFTYSTFVNSKWKLDFGGSLKDEKITVTIGPISHTLDAILHRGSSGATVYRGKYQQIDVAVKKLSPNVAHLGKNMIKILHNLKFKYIIQIHHMEVDNGFLYIASTLAQCNLRDYVNNKLHGQIENLDSITLIKQITIGLKYLHDSNILHGHLTPGNILISCPNKGGKLIALLSDFESSINIKELLSSSYDNKQIQDTWISPELLSEDAHWSQIMASDIYSLGLIYFYILTNGKQMFAQAADKLNNDLLAKQLSEIGILSSVVKKMVSTNKDERPSCSEILANPEFWSTARKIKFIQAVMRTITYNNEARDKLQSSSRILLNAALFSHGQQDILADDQLGMQSKQSEDYMQLPKSYTGGKLIPPIICAALKMHTNKERTSENTETTRSNLNSPEVSTEQFIIYYPAISGIMYKAMRTFKEEPLLQMYYRNQILLSSSSLKGNWNDIQAEIFQSILLKMPLKSKNKACLASKNWRMKAVKKKMPTLLKTMNTEEHMWHISFSNHGKLFAVCHLRNIKINDTNSFTTKFYRDLDDPYDSHFNSNDSLILVHTYIEMIIMYVSVGLPIISTVPCYNVAVKQPWLRTNLFISAREENGTTTFWLNKVPQMRHKDTKQCQIFKSNCNLKNGKIFNERNCTFLIYKKEESKLEFKRFLKTDIQDFARKVDDESWEQKEEFETVDNEVDCKQVIEDFILVPNGHMKVIALTRTTLESPYCFFIIDILTFQVTSSNIVIPTDYKYFWNCLQSNGTYLISGSSSKCVYVWDIKSGHLVTKINHTDQCVTCAIHPKDNQLVITAGVDNCRINLWHLNDCS